jgi:DNA-binding CsgD family transcriptional regulator/tetratricopeptide (TPR) repeat protein
MAVRKQPQLRGRDRELDMLSSALASARTGRPAIVVVEGEAGLGKTRLVEEVTSHNLTERDLLVLAHGVDLMGGQLPFGVISELMRSMLHRTDRVASIELAAGARSVVDVFESSRPSSAIEAMPRGDFYIGFATLLETLAAAELVWLAVEDAQWADESSLELLEYVGKVVTTGRLLTTYTVRIGEGLPTAAFAHFTNELTRATNSSTITLTPLDRAATTELVAELAGETPTAKLMQRIHAMGEGNPFLTEELVRGGLREDGPLPDSAQALMRSRVERLSAAGSTMVKAASLAYGALTAEPLARVLEYDVQTLDAALEEALAHRVMDREHGAATYRFHHALLQQAISTALSPGQRRDWHRAWAEAIESDLSHSVDPWMATIAAAHQWVGSGDVERAFDACLAAADQAPASHAPSERAPLLALALAMWDRVPDASTKAGRERDELAMSTIRATHFAGDWEGALALIEAELRHPDTDRDPVRRATLELSRQGTLEQLDRSSPSDFAPRVAEFSDLLLAAPDGPWLANGCLEASWRNRWAGQRDRSIRLAERATSAARTQDDGEAQLRAGQTLADTLASQDRMEETFQVLDGLVELTTKRMPERVSDVEAQLSWFLCASGALVDGLAVAERAVRRIPSPQMSSRLFAYVAQNLAHALIELGRLEEAKRWLDDATQVYPEGWTAFQVRAESVHVACCLGDLEAAQATADALWELVPYDERGPLTGLGRGGRARIALATLAATKGEVARVRESMAPIWVIPDLRDETDSAWRAVLMAARAEADEARRNRGRVRRKALGVEAESHVETLARVGGELYSWGTLSPAWRKQLAAELDRFRGDDETAQWREVHDAWAEMGARHDQAWASLRLAEAHAGQGERDQAQAAAAEALDLARDMGAKPLQDAVRAFATHARLPFAAPQSDDRPPDVELTRRLTRREVEVLQLVAQGRSNEQIAKTLFISPKTASVHVSRLLAKLGADSRSEAAALAHRHGLIED